LLRSRPVDVGIQDPPAVWAIAADISIEEDVITIVALSDGNASLYTTGEFGIIGGGSHDGIRAAAVRACKLAATELAAATPTLDFAHAKGGGVRFFLLTPSDVRVIVPDADADTLAEGKHRYSELFLAVNAVLTELRLSTERERSR
jgi:hypothetical protein